MASRRVRGGRIASTAARLVVCATVVAVAAGCVAPQGSAGSVTTTVPEHARGCNPLALTACGLPFPSDSFTVADPSSPTGRTVLVRNGLVSDGYTAAVPDSMSPAGILNGASGFSVTTPVLFELGSELDPASLPADGGEAFVVFDTTTGERVPIRAEVDSEAARAAEPSAVVRAWPAVRFEHSHHYLAAITRELRAADGTPQRPSDGLVAALGGVDPELSAELQPWFTFLADRGLEGPSLVSLTEFTVRAEADVQGRMLEPVAKAGSRRHRAEVDAVEPADKPAGALLVKGRVELTNFQRPDGSFDAAAGGHPYWTTFQMLVPPSAADSPAPVAIFGHGYGGNKTRMIEFSGDNAEAGVATLAIDWSYRGTRTVTDGEYVITLDEPSDQGRYTAMFNQGVVDVASLRAAVEESLAELDVQPSGGDGVADLDTSRVIYEGTSYGGIVGTAALGAVPDLDGGILHVSGTGVMDVFVRTPIWPMQKGLIPANGPGTDVALGVALLQHAVDGADGANWAHTYRDPLDGGPSRPVLLQYGEDDSWVHNPASEALVDIAALPPVDLPVEPGVSPFTDGYGWQMISNDGSVPDWAWGMYAHSLSTTTPEARTVTSAWLAELPRG